MQLTTTLPFPHVTFKHWALDDTEAAVLIVKGTFGVHGDGSLGVIEDQADIVETDVFRGDENASSLVQEQELAPAKPYTDVMLNAVARAPGGDACPDWPVSVEIKDRAFYEFYVRGPSVWEKPKGKWKLSTPEPVLEVPILYELAYGGSVPDEEGVVAYDHNPVGAGFVTEDLLENEAMIPAPQIGDLAEFMACDIKANMIVHGFGPRAKAWLPRRSEAGTFDASWQATRHPRMPEDYSFAYWNAAPKQLQVDPYLKGGEKISLKGLRHDLEPYVITLPKVGVAAHKGGLSGPKSPLHLTDVMIDVVDADQNKHRATLIWRGMFADPDTIETLHIAAMPIKDEPDE